MKYFILLFFILVGCGTTEVARPHLHNFPYLGECPSLEDKHIDDEEKLKAEAKALNMRYVDYLHLLSNSPPQTPTNKNVTTNE